MDPPSSTPQIYQEWISLPTPSLVEAQQPLDSIGPQMRLLIMNLLGSGG